MNEVDRVTENSKLARLIIDGDAAGRLKAAKDLIVRHKAYIKGLEQAQDLSELEPSNEARRAAAVKDHQRNTEIQKQARKMSVFGDMFHTATMLYGPFQEQVTTSSTRSGRSSSMRIFDIKI